MRRFNNLYTFKLHMFHAKQFPCRYDSIRVSLIFSQYQFLAPFFFFNKPASNCLFDFSKRFYLHQYQSAFINPCVSCNYIHRRKGTTWTRKSGLRPVLISLFLYRVSQASFCARVCLLNMQTRRRQRFYPSSRTARHIFTRFRS